MLRFYSGQAHALFCGWHAICVKPMPYIAKEVSHTYFAVIRWVFLKRVHTSIGVKKASSGSGWPLARAKDAPMIHCSVKYSQPM